MSQLKRYNGTNWETVGGVVTGDTLPLGSEVDYDGEYCPAGWVEISDPNSYSTSEVLTDKTWIDGKPIYRKTFQFTTANNTSWTLLENNNYDYIINVNGEVYSNEHYIGIIKYLNFYRLNGNLYYQNQSSFSQNKQVTFWIEYTKTS